MPSFPTVTLVESFLRTESPFAQAKWEKIQGMTAKGRTSATAGWYPVTASGSGSDGVYQTEKQFTNPGVCVTVNGAGSTEAPRYRGIWCCLSEPNTVNISGYKLKIENTTKWVLEKHNKSATGTVLAEKTEATTTASGDKFGISVEGGKVFAWWKKGAGAWTVIIEAADSAFTKGLIGVSGNGNIEGAQGERNLEAGNGEGHKEQEKFAASLSFSGTLRKTSEPLLAQLSFAGTRSTKVSRLLHGALSFTGSLIKAYPLLAVLSLHGRIHKTVKTKFPPVTILDNFMRGENPLSNEGKWSLSPFAPTTKHPGACVLSEEEGKIIGGAYLSVDEREAGQDAAYWNVQEFHSPLGVAGTLSSGGAGNVGYIYACVNPAESGSGYQLSFAASGLIKVKPTLALARFDKGVETFLSSIKIAAATQFGLSVTEGIVGVWERNEIGGEWHLLFSVTDSTYTKGYAGIGALGFGTVSNFEAGSGFTQRFIAELFSPEDASSFAALPRDTKHQLPAALTFLGNLGRNTLRRLTGSLSFAGVFRKTSERFQAALSFAGSIDRNTTRQLVASLPFSGSIVPRLEIVVQRFAAALSFTGVSPRNISYALLARLEFTGGLPLRIIRALIASANFIGILPRDTTRQTQANLSFSGSSSREITHQLPALLTFSTTLLDHIIYLLRASLAFVGELPKRFTLIKPINANLESTGQEQPNITTAQKASLSFAGLTLRNVILSQIAALNFAGLITRNPIKIFEAALTPFGLLDRNTAHPLTAALSFSGFLRISGEFVQRLAASLSFSASSQRSTSYPLTASVTFAGSLRRSLVRTIEASLASAGELQRSIRHELAAELALAAETGRTIYLQLLAELSLAGEVAQTAIRQFLARLEFSGSLTPSSKIIQVLAATLSFNGRVTSSNIVKAFRAVLNLFGEINFERSQGVKTFADTLILKHQYETIPTLTLRRNEAGDVYGLINHLEGYPEMEVRSVVARRKVFGRGR